MHLTDIDIMYRHAERQYPNECCGVIIGDAADPSKSEVISCTNIQHELKEKYPHLYSRDADTGYFIDPKELKAAFDRASKLKLAVIGFYHSHPNHDAYWSEEDNRAAMWGDEPSFPGAFHVVISIYNGKAKGYAAFGWDADSKSFKNISPG